MTDPNRCCFRWSLRTMFVAVTVAASFSGWCTWNLQKVRQRDEALAILKLKASRAACAESADSIMGTNRKPIPWAWRLLGARAMAAIWFDSKGLPENTCHQIKDAFPEADVAYERGMIWSVD